jgi:hypothetical protein
MPTSHFHQLNEIVEALVLLEPRSVLDVGVGLGKFGALAREYLELRQGRCHKTTWECRIDGIEAFAPYLSPLHDYVYNHVFVGEAQTVIPQLTEHYDVALVIDVVEHLEHLAGERAIAALQRHATNLVISTPKRFIPQGAGCGNPHETHRSLWTQRDLTRFGPVCFVPNEFSFIGVIGPDQHRVAQELFSPRRYFKRQFPFLADFYRLIKTGWK